MANEVRYTRNGRRYKLVEDGSDTIECEGCAFLDGVAETEGAVCPRRKSDGFLACTLGDSINCVFIEEKSSKGIHPFRVVLSAIRDVLFFSATGQGRNQKDRA